MERAPIELQVSEALVANYVETGQTALRSGVESVARSMLFRAVRQAAKLPPRNSKKAMALANLAVLCAERKRFKLAESLYQSAIAIYEYSDETDCRSSATTLLALLADLNADRSRYARATRLYKQVFDRYEQLPEKEHGKISSICDRLAEIARLMGRYAQAERWSRKALSFHNLSKSPCCLLYSTHLQRLGLIFCHQGRYDRARKIYNLLAQLKAS